MCNSEPFEAMTCQQASLQSATTASSDPPPPPCLSSLPLRGMYPHLKGRCVTHSTHAIFRRKKVVPPSDFRLFSSSLSHPP